MAMSSADEHVRGDASLVSASTPLWRACAQIGRRYELVVEAVRSTASSTTCLDVLEMERREGAKRRGRRRGLG